MRKKPKITTNNGTKRCLICCGILDHTDFMVIIMV